MTSNPTNSTTAGALRAFLASLPPDTPVLVADPAGWCSALCFPRLAVAGGAASVVLDLDEHATSVEEE